MSEASESSPRPTDGAPKVRVPWIDMARGVCVIAVVLVHVVLFHVSPLSDSPNGEPLLKLWLFGNSEILAYVRMPLLLFVSGWLAASKVAQGLGSPRTRLSIATNTYLFAVWTLIYAVADRLLAPGPEQITSPADSVPHFVSELLYPTFGPLWFVYALAVGTAFLALTRRLPVWVVLTALVLIGWIVERATADQAGVPRVIFFAVGVYLGPKIATGFLTRRRIVQAMVISVVFGVPLLVLSPTWQYPVSVLACAPLAIVCLAFIRHLARWRRLNQVLSWVGRRTLGIYVLHWLIVGLLVFWGRQSPATFAFLRGHQVAPILYAIGVTAVIVPACIAVEKLLRRARLGVLFTPPHAVARLVGAATVLPTAASARG